MEQERQEQDAQERAAVERERRVCVLEQQLESEQTRGTDQAPKPVAQLGQSSRAKAGSRQRLARVE